MGKVYYKKLPLFHLYDSDLTCTQKLLMTLLLVNQFDIYDLSCLARMRPEDVAADLAELKRKGDLQDSSEPRIGFTDARGAARFRAKSRGFGKSIPLAYGEGIDRRVSSGFQQNRILRQTAKQVFGNANPLCCFHHKNLGGFYEHQK